MAHVDFTHFDMRMIALRSNVLIYGKKNSGKTTLMLNLLLHIHHHYPLGCAIAPTASVRIELAKHMPSSLIWPEFDLTKLTTVVSKFTESTMPDWMENVNDKQNKTTKEADILNWLLLMDDVGYDEKRFQHVTFKNLYMNGRQIGLGTVLNLQKLKSIPPGLRGQLDYVFFFRDLSFKGQENINREFFSFLPFPTFRELYLKCTEGYNCIVLDIAKAQRMRDLGHSPKSLTECIFVCSSLPISELPAFNMFHPYVWKLDIAVKRLFKRRALATQLKQTSSNEIHFTNNRHTNQTSLLFQARVEPKMDPPKPTEFRPLEKRNPPSPTTKCGRCKKVGELHWTHHFPTRICGDCHQIVIPRRTKTHPPSDNVDPPNLPPIDEEPIPPPIRNLHKSPSKVPPNQPRTPPPRIPPSRTPPSSNPVSSNPVSSKPVSPKAITQPQPTITVPSHARYSGYPISTFSSLRTIPTVKILKPSNRQLIHENQNKGTAPVCSGGTCKPPRQSLGFVPR